MQQWKPMAKKKLARHLGRVRAAHRDGSCPCGASIPQGVKKGNYWFRTKAKYRDVPIRHAAEKDTEASE